MILRGKSATLDDIERLAERLKNGRYFEYARRLFARARAHPEFPKLAELRQLRAVQRHALCTYRDLDLPATCFADAISILEQGDLRRGNVSNETLGLAGAIHKYQWMLNGSRRDLERSLYFYERGAERRVEDDQGYTAINAAFVLDVLAKLQRNDARDAAAQRKEKARAFRESIITVLPGLPAQRSNAWLRNEYWYYATLAEACFGLSRHDEARYWLREELPLEPPEWELESTSRQLVALADAQEQDLNAGSDAYRTLRLLVGDAPDALRAMTMGKVGIALSGGGFRASFFHIGVLARLAELDVLRHVDVLSCVSGGSIIGAQYYLEVRRLLQQKNDREITRADYLDIIRRLERDFMTGVRKNIRTRLFAGWWANLWSLVNPYYTRTVYLGNLLERHLYRRVDDGHTDWRRSLDELRIRPQDGPDDFNPKLDNGAVLRKADPAVECDHSKHGPQLAIFRELDGRTAERAVFANRPKRHLATHVLSRGTARLSKSAAGPSSSGLRMCTVAIRSDPIRRLVSGPLVGAVGRWWRPRQSGHRRSAGATMHGHAGQRRKRPDERRRAVILRGAQHCSADEQHTDGPSARGAAA